MLLCGHFCFLTLRILRNFALCANSFAQFRFLRNLRKYAQNLLRGMRNNAEFCAKIILFDAQKFVKVRKYILLREIHSAKFAKKNCHSLKNLFQELNCSI